VKHRLLAAIVAPVVAALAAVLLSTTAASAHEILVVCDEETGDLVWSNTTPDAVPGTVVTSNGLTVEVPATGSVTTEHPGPGTWMVTWTTGETAEGTLPPVCTEATTTAAPTTAAPTTAAPTSMAPGTTGPTSGGGASGGETEVAGVTVVPAAGSSGAETLPATGSDWSLAAVAGIFIAAGAAAMLVARRTART
jgi:LPXTG-motif cell wall-anchored protein